MKIAYVYPEYLPSRKARGVQVVSTCHALAQHAEKLYLFITAPSASSEEIFRYYGLSCPHNLVVVTLRRRWGLFVISSLFQWSLKRCLRKFGCQVLISRHLQTFLGLPSGICTIFESHALLSEKPGVSEKIAAMEAEVFQRVDAVAYLNPYLRQRAGEIYSPNCLQEVIPSGTSISPLDKTMGRPTRDFLYIGSTRYPWKGIGVLLKALEFLPEATLHLVGPLEGSWSGKNPLIQRFTGQGRLKIYGYLPPERVRLILREFEIAVLPNTSEDVNSRLYTSPLKLLEYMAAQIAVVASDLPSVRQLVTETEVLFVKPDDPEALASGIKTLLNEPERRSLLARNAWERAKMFSWDQRALKFENLAHKALDQRRNQG